MSRTLAMNAAAVSTFTPGTGITRADPPVAELQEDVACSGELQVGGDLGAEPVSPEGDRGVDVRGHQMGVVEPDQEFTSGSGVIGARTRTTFVVLAL
jgi:hypothetical protein